jgi:hypothetical protein
MYVHGARRTGRTTRSWSGISTIFPWRCWTEQEPRQQKARAEQGDTQVGDTPGREASMPGSRTPYRAPQMRSRRMRSALSRASTGSVTAPLLSKPSGATRSARVVRARYPSPGRLRPRPAGEAREQRGTGELRTGGAGVTPKFIDRSGDPGSEELVRLAEQATRDLGL